MDFAYNAPVITSICSIGTLIFLGFIIFNLIFLPQELKFTVTDALFEQFNLSSINNSTILFYNLALNITIRNPNKKVGVFYNRIQVILIYRKKRFSSATLNSTTSFYQGHKNTTFLQSIILQGQQRLSFEECDIEKYDSEKSGGIFRVDVKIALRVRTRYGKFKSRHFKPSKIDCDKLKVPLVMSSTRSLNFNTTKCNNVYVITSPTPRG